MTADSVVLKYFSMYDTIQTKETVILIAVDPDDREDYSFSTEDSLSELAELAETAGALVVGRMIQKLPAPHPSTYLGSGKIDELKAVLAQTEADGIIADDELSNSQMSALQQLLDCKIMDRTMLILDIFASHARSAEGMLQVELAQLNYRMTRLTGKGISMSRLGGGIGTRGPGEKKLEVDRRVIRNRIALLNRELRELQSHRDTTRKMRSRNNCPVFAIVGYTNVGKSTLLNALTGADILAQDQLFATLDTTTRRYTYHISNNSREVLLTDTVGFIRKLPHHLIEAFKSTLRETEYADYIIHVVDASDPACSGSMEVVYSILEQLSIKGKKIITLFNKTDLISENVELRDAHAKRTLRISAKTGAGLDKIPEILEEMITDDYIAVTGIIPYSKLDILNEIRKNGRVTSEKYTEDGVELSAMVSPALAGVILE